MNGIDIGILLLAALFGVRGLFQGLVSGILGLIGMLAGFFLAVRSMGEIAPWLEKILSIGPPASSVLALMLVYSVVTLAFHLLGRVLGSWFHRIRLGMVDHAGGFVLGVLKGFWVASVFLLLLTLVPLPPGVEEERKDSLLAGPVATFAPATFNFLKHIVPSTDSLMDEWKEGTEKTLLP